MMNVREFIRLAIAEDTADPSGLIPVGDHSASSCLDSNEIKRARLIIKDQGIIAGLKVAEFIFAEVDPKLRVTLLLEDGDIVKYGDIGLEVEGRAVSILLAERLVLNTMQRMSGIATKTNEFVQKIAHTSCKVLDTRKTTPNFRYFEKEAVRIGGGVNHRFGLYDMIMLKDNHIDYCGGIAPAIRRAKDYIVKLGIDLPIEVETRNLDEVKQVIEEGGVFRVMLDNFSPEKCKEAVDWVQGRIPLEASGGINLETILSYAESGVDYVSIGSLTYSYKSLDISLKAI
jgi:nicotinate-nucleotide pyrophosphorylase (carboxylating)